MKLLILASVLALAACSIRKDQAADSTRAVDSAFAKDSVRHDTLSDTLKPRKN